ncbi:MAG: LysR family transcriptional regulator [Porticoccaceae bacterium]|nr:LysR family transcriptional regulator [Pseudomonadales bacterium]MCP5171745.1 LysR family transcriptional regulator [Pseudomonadales bacterium]
MDTQLLEAFIAVAESHSFSIAAERIHLTQPAVSKRISLLEEQLNCRLFDRIARSVSLTEAGEALLPRAKLILQDIVDTQQAINDLSGAITGRLRLAISHHIGLHRLPPVLKTFSQHYPEVSIDVDFMDSEKAYDGILHGNFEVAAITLSPSPHPKVFAESIWPDPLVFMVAKEHELAKTPGVTLEVLSRYPAILPGSGTYTGRMTKAQFDRHGISLPSGMATNYLETIKMMVSIGLGWSLLPSSMLESGLSQVPISGIYIERQLGYIHHREKTLSNAARAFIELLKSEKQ